MPLFAPVTMKLCLLTSASKSLVANFLAALVYPLLVTNQFNLELYNVHITKPRVFSKSLYEPDGVSVNGHPQAGSKNVHSIHSMRLNETEIYRIRILYYVVHVNYIIYRIFSGHVGYTIYDYTLLKHTLFYTAKYLYTFYIIWRVYEEAD